MTKLQEKMYYTTCGYILCIGNILLLDTRFNLFGLGLGFASAYMFIRALLIKNDK
jgi:hypothetical protein